MFVFLFDISSKIQFFTFLFKKQSLAVLGNKYVNIKRTALSTKLNAMSSNLTKNSTSPDSLRNYEGKLIFSEGLKIFLYLLYTLVFLVGVVGNGLVCYVLGVKKKRRNSGDIFVISLAITDFLSSIIIPLVMVHDVMTDLEMWCLGKIGCLVLPAVSPATVTASCWFLVLIALDRYR